MSEQSITYYSEIPNTPAAIGPYSKATEKSGFVFTSGQLGIDPATGKLVSDDVEAQTKQALANIKEVLRATGLSFFEVVKTTIFLTDLKDFQRVNAIYEAELEGAKPARSTVQVAALPAGGKIEIETIAAR